MTNENQTRITDGCEPEDTRNILPRYRGERAAGVHSWLRGVFEGGGAKGLAYRGALEAVEESGCWFEAVAGSSAGAITAALIAAGYSPRELNKPMEQLLELLRLPGPFKAVNRLRKTGEILRRDAFREKLEELLAWKCGLFGVQLSAGELTFERLHETTGVDLYIVAADVSLRRPVVFHHRYTPKCQVADAVMASSSIPFIFDGGMLTADASILPPSPQAGRRVGLRVFRTVVDGGVWTNFPMFVFKDATFHDYMSEALGLERETSTHLPGPVVGFMLHELRGNERGKIDEQWRLESARAAYAGARFERESPHGWRLAPIEQTGRDLATDQSPALPTGESWRYGPSAPRWRNPRRESNRSTLILMDKTLLWASQTWFVALALLGIALAEWLLLVVPGQYVWKYFRDGQTTGGWSEFCGVIALSLFAGIYVAQLCSAVVLLFGSLLSNWALLLPARRVLCGLAKTLVATPGTVPWEHLRADVIALEVPAPLTTLRVPKNPAIVAMIIERAKAKTKLRLREILIASGVKAADPLPAEG